MPLEALVANPRDYDGYYIYSDGFLKLEYHGDFLYPSCATAQAGRWTGRIGIPDQKYDTPGGKPMEGFVYHVVGTFNYSDMAVRNARLHLLPPRHEGFHGCEFDEEIDTGPLAQENATPL